MGAIHGRGYYDRIGLGEACFSGARGRCRGSDGSAQAASACAGSGVLQSTAVLSGWPGGVRDGALLGAGVARAWARGAADAGAIREGVHQAQQARCRRCGSDLRGGSAPDDALCAGQDGRPASCRAAASWPGAAGAPAYGPGERFARPSGRVRCDRAAGLAHVGDLIAIVRADGDTRLPDVARQVLQVLANQIEQIEAAISALERQLLAWHKSNPVSQRLASIPGIGPIIATAIATTVADPNVFRSGREFAAWLGLVPRQNSTGGKIRLGGITKRGNRYLRRLLINGASANLLRSKATKADPWVIGLRRRRPPLVVAVALANKTARIAWAVMLRQNEYQPRAVAA